MWLYLNTSLETLLLMLRRPLRSSPGNVLRIPRKLVTGIPENMLKHALTSMHNKIDLQGLAMNAHTFFGSFYSYYTFSIHISDIYYWIMGYLKNIFKLPSAASWAASLKKLACSIFMKQKFTNNRIVARGFIIVDNFSRSNLLKIGKDVF